jgi:CubicO group peptidase (beta-lactamase class C family)
VRDTFADNLNTGRDLGASIAVFVDGECVVDLWGGYFDQTLTREIDRRTISQMFSSTKTITALCALVLADRGELDLHAPVARYWPEFAAAGKGGIQVRQLLNHSAGMAAWTGTMTLQTLCDVERSTAMLTRQAPLWKPGTAHGYHGFTQGHLVGEVVRRITGKSLGTFLREEITTPLGVGDDLHIGTAAEYDPHVSLIVSYNPFVRGTYPVGVRTITIRDSSRNLTVEIWHPALDCYRGMDLDPATKDRYTIGPEMPVMSHDAVRDADPATRRFPLLICNHGTFGHRRVMSSIATRLASHGYVVAAPDVPGDTLSVMMRDAINQREGRPIARPALQEINRQRPYFASFTIDRLLAGDDPQIAAIIDADRIGAFGQSAGGWNTLRLNSVDRRTRASMAIEPMFGKRSPLKGLAEMASWLDVNDWGRPVATLVLAGGADAFIMLDDLRDLYAELPAPKRFVNMPRAGHMHFTDGAEIAHETFRKMYMTAFPDPDLDGPATAERMRPFAELVSEADAADVVRALALAHFDAELKGSGEARAFLDDHLAATLAARGIDVEVAAPAGTAPTLVEVR